MPLLAAYQRALGSVVGTACLPRFLIAYRRAVLSTRSASIGAPQAVAHEDERRSSHDQRNARRVFGFSKGGPSGMVPGLDSAG